MPSPIFTTPGTIIEDSPSTLGEFWRFAIVGVINTLINFAILNLLSHLTGKDSGTAALGYAAIAFTIATVNSYLLNKNWSFKDHEHEHAAKKFTMFLLVSLVGLIINSGTIYAITTYIKVPAGLLSSVISTVPVVAEKFVDPGVLWLNIAAVVATCLALIWNFIGYKFFVFKK